MRLRLGRVGAFTLSSLSFNAEVELAQQAHQRFVLVTTQFMGASEIATRRHSGGGGPGLVVVDSADSVVVKRFSADSERLNLRIDEIRLRALCASLIGRSLGQPLEFDPLIQAGELPQRRWLSLMRTLLDYAVTPPAAGVAERLLTHLEEMVMLMLLTEHRHNYSELLDRPEPAIAPRHVKAAEEFIRANAAEALTLVEIARNAGVSIRTLTAGFQAYRQTTPMKHLREVRLSFARDDLRQAMPGDTVSDIALRWGFGNFGRFAAEYHRRFGERPSDTLRLCR